jgi:RNA polymerase sigma factor (sigma-70 family)
MLDGDLLPIFEGKAFFASPSLSTMQQYKRIVTQNREKGRATLDREETAEKPGFSQLMERAAAGDSQAQLAICQQYEQQVRIVARVLLGPLLRPHLDSVDIMQSVHHSLLMGIRDQRFEIATPDKLVALACTIVRRKVARKWRVHRRQNRVGDSGGFILESLQELAETQESPSRAAQYQDAIQSLYASLNSIEKTMLERRLEGFTTDEVAHQLGMNPVAIRVRWTRLRQRLQEANILADWT